VLNNRRLILSGNNSGDHIIQNANTNANNTITIHSDIDIPSTSNRDLILNGVNTGDNLVAGVIPDGSNSVTTLKKEQAGTWVLSGANTYSGPTFVSGGVLKLAASECLPDATTLTINGGTIELEAGVRERVDHLTLGGTVQTNLTTYGSSASSASIQDDSRFAGSGLLFLGFDPPPQGTLLMLQ
jgi:fibronectin-binding autotransporter adhesin